MLRAREGAFHVTEQLGFDQRGYQGGAVHGSKRLVVARPGEMNGARHEFLAGAAFPENQDGIVVLTYLFDQPVHLLHPGRSADQPAKSRARSKLLAQDAIFLVYFEGADHAVELPAKLGDVERLGDVIHGAHARGLHGALDRAVLRQDNHGRLRIHLPDKFKEFDSAQLRDAQIGDDDVHGILLKDFDGLFGGGRRSRLQSGIGNHVTAQISRGVLIIHNQGSNGHGPFHRCSCSHSTGHDSCPPLGKNFKFLSCSCKIGTK